MIDLEIKPTDEMHSDNRARYKSRPPINSSVKGLEKNWMKKALCLEKGSGGFSFWGGFEAEIYQIFCPQTAFQVPTHLVHAGVCRLNGTSRRDYSVRFSSGLRARTSVLPVDLRGYLSLRECV